jgi:hypothetical protein
MSMRIANTAAPSTPAEAGCQRRAPQTRAKKYAPAPYADPMKTGVRSGVIHQAQSSAVRAGSPQRITTAGTRMRVTIRLATRVSGRTRSSRAPAPVTAPRFARSSGRSEVDTSAPEAIKASPFRRPRQPLPPHRWCERAVVSRSEIGGGRHHAGHLHLLSSPNLVLLPAGQRGQGPRVMSAGEAGKGGPAYAGARATNWYRCLIRASLRGTNRAADSSTAATRPGGA